MKYWVAYLIIFLCMPVKAAVITYDFNGTFSRIEGSSPDVISGDLFQATFSYDNETPLSRIVEVGTRAIYNTGIINITSGVNNYTATASPQLQILNDWIGVSCTFCDNFFLSVEIPDALGTGFYILQLDMWDTTATSIDSLEIPSEATLEGMATNGRLFLRRFTSRDIEEWFASGNFTSITAVPIPAAAWLFGSGLLGLIEIARRKKA